MWKLLAASGALILAGTPPLHGQEFPWCVKMDVFTRNCGFASYNDCVAIAKNADATCIRNPNYQPPSAGSHPKAAASKPPNAQR